jgi:hypothetical protein
MFAYEDFKYYPQKYMNREIYQLKKYLFIIIVLLFGSSFLLSQTKEFGIQKGIMKSWGGTAYPVGLTGTYYYNLDSNYTFTGSISYFRYCTKPIASIFSDYGHTVMPLSIGARYSFKQGDFRV